MISDHADAQRVEQPRLAADQHRVDQVLDEVRRRDAQQRHQQGADDAFEQHAAMQPQQAQEPAGGAFRASGLASLDAALRRASSAAGSRSSGCRTRRATASERRGRVGHDDRLVAGAVQDDEVPEAFGRLDVGDGRQGGSGQRLVRAFDGLGGEADSLGGLHEAQQVGADAVGAGQVAHGLQAELAGRGGERWSPGRRRRSRCRRSVGRSEIA